MTTPAERDATPLASLPKCGRCKQEITYGVTHDCKDGPSFIARLSRDDSIHPEFLRGLREAAEIARERAKNLRQSAARYRADLNATGEDRCEKAATYLEKAAEIIEARAKEKQP
jgi:hypothetical protein